MTSLPDGIFDKLTNLESLNISNNDLTSLPAGVFSKNKNLQVLSMGFNKYEIKNIPGVDSLFKGLSKMTFLQAEFTPLGNAPANWFKDLSSLQELHLFNCEMTLLSPALFDPLVNLTVIDFTENHFTEIPIDFFKNNTKLTTIYFLHCKLTKDKLNNVFEALPSLTKLHIDGNPDILCIPTSNTHITDAVPAICGK